MPLVMGGEFVCSPLCPQVSQGLGGRGAQEVSRSLSLPCKGALHLVYCLLSS